MMTTFLATREGKKICFFFLPDNSFLHDHKLDVNGGVSYFFFDVQTPQKSIQMDLGSKKFIDKMVQPTFLARLNAIFHRYFALRAMYRYHMSKQMTLSFPVHLSVCLVEKMPPIQCS